jgi:hypothetical protein
VRGLQADVLVLCLHDFIDDSLPWAPKATRRVLTQLRKDQRPLFVNFGDVPAEHQ